MKRPGRVDIKVPIFPTTTPRESFDLIRNLSQRCGVAIDEVGFGSLESRIPMLLTPGAAEDGAYHVSVTGDAGGTPISVEVPWVIARNAPQRGGCAS